MRAYELRDGFGFDHLQLVDRHDPGPGPGEVVVAVKAVTLNYRDLMVVRGQYSPKLPLPRIPCSDGSGVVEAAGAGVSRVKVGDRVAGCFFPDWIEGPPTLANSKRALGGSVDGMLAERVVLGAESVVPVPSYLEVDEAAALPCAALTAWNALFESPDPIRPGETVLAIGTGGVSTFAAQFAKLAGARAIVTSRSDEKLAKLRDRIGDFEGIDTSNHPEWQDRAVELTGGEGVDRVVEVGGSGTLPRSLAAVRPGGEVAVIGVLSGTGGEVGPLAILRKSIKLRGIYVGSRAMFERMNRAIEAGNLRPVIDRAFGFADALDAFRYMDGQSHFGKVAIRFD